MRLFVAFVHDLQTPFDRVEHCDPMAPVFAFSMPEMEDEYATIELSREQRGWGFLAPSQPKCVLVSWSPTGRPEDALLLARARINELPGDLLGRRQVLRGICAPRDIDKRVLAWEKENRSTYPETYFLFSDADPEDASAYLLGRSEVFHVDPVTHEIRTIGETVGDRLIDMSDTAFFQNGMASDGPGEFGRICRVIRGKLTVAWTQEATGVCNVGPLISSPRSSGAPFETLDKGFADNLQSMLTTDVSEGWSVATGGYSHRLSSFPTPYFYSGTTYVRYESNPYNPRVDHNPPNSALSWLDVGEVTELPCDVRLEVYSISNVRLTMAYTYTQPREEVVFAAMELPILDTGIEDEDDEVVEFTLKNPFEDPRAKDWEAGVEYKAGDVVRHNGFIYTCRADHYSTDFRQAYRAFDFGITTQFSNLLEELGAGATTYWKEQSPETSLNSSSYSIVDTDFGRQAIEHLMCRLRKEGIRRLRARRIGMRFRWEDAAHLTRADSIQISVYDRDPLTDLPRLVPVRGKVLTLRREWPEAGPATIFVEIGVSFANHGEPFEPQDSYGPSDYAIDDYAQGSERDFYYQVDSDPVRKPVLVERLSTRGYAVQSFRIENDARKQFAAARVLAAEKGDVRRAPQVCPSWAALSMRPLASSGTLRREIDVVGYLETIPGGTGVFV